MSRKALRIQFWRRTIILMVALGMPLATIPRAPACECAPPGVESQRGSSCCQVVAISTSSCCTPQAESPSGCQADGQGECDCPKCQGEMLPQLDLISKSDRLSADGPSQLPHFATLVELPSDAWLAGRCSERPPPAIYLARHGPQLERLCRWLI